MLWDFAEHSSLLLFLQPGVPDSHWRREAASCLQIQWATGHDTVMNFSSFLLLSLYRLSYTKSTEIEDESKAKVEPR